MHLFPSLVTSENKNHSSITCSKWLNYWFVWENSARRITEKKKDSGAGRINEQIFVSFLFLFFYLFLILSYF